MRTKPELRLSIDQKRIVWSLRRHGPTSRIDLSRRLGLPPAALTRIVRELAAMNIIDVAEPAANGSRGRPTVPVALSGRAGYAIGATVHPGWLETVAVDFSGRLVAHESLPFKSKKLDDFLKAIQHWMEKLGATDPVFRSKFLGLGIACPGAVTAQDQSHRHVVSWLEGWRKVDIVARSMEVLGLPVWLENDANCAALAELYCGDLLQTATTAIVFFLGHGVGGGVIINRDLFLGEHCNAGEIGLLYPPDAPRPSGIDLMDQLSLSGANIKSLFNVEELLLRYPDAIAEWCNRVAQQLETAVLGGLAWLDPGAIVLAGALPNQILFDLCTRISSSDWANRNPHLRKPKIYISSLGSDLVARGAALLPVHACTVFEQD
jgi:predicted NBD/HSP70 family sugar kinase